MVPSGSLKIAIDSRTNDLYLGTDSGVWKLTGGSGNWAPFGARLGNVQCETLTQFAQQYLTIATYGRARGSST